MSADTHRSAAEDLDQELEEELAIEDEGDEELADIEAELDEGEVELVPLVDVDEPDEGPPAAMRVSEAEEDGDLGDTDVEPTLDVLFGGLIGAREEAEESEEVEEAEPLSLARESVKGAGVGEFVCAGCFLIWSRSNLADPRRRLCRDCADTPASSSPAA